MEGSSFPLPPTAPGWTRKQLRHALQKNDGGVWGEDPDGGDSDYIVLRSTEQSVDGSWRIDNPAIRKLTEREFSNSCLLEGDLLVTKSSGSELHIGKASIVTKEIADLRCAFSNFMQRLRLNTDYEPRFVRYCLNSSLGREQMAWSSSSTSGLANLSAGVLGSLEFLFPEQKAQVRIANFLDQETAKINALIADKERLLALLEERRQSLITQAVTRGLDPSVPMKDSGIPWLGQIPAHWTLVPLKHVADLQTGLTLGKDFRGFKDLVTRPYLRVANVQAGFIDTSDVTEIEVPLAVARTVELRQGDVLLTEGGDLDKLGRGEVWDGSIENCLHQNHIFSVRPNLSRLMPEHLALLTQSLHGRHYFTSTGIRSTNLATTNSSKLMAFPVPLPPIGEQTTIEAHIQQLSLLSLSVAQSIQNHVSLLRERRASLIHEAVTGKVDSN